ncbi:hypothetical protein Gorai_013241 [Gossypium raimondii]|uniref:Uncharacterized protein n=1 Tax=Gossypium raimondii TaxID=29730 RepID=A0A7J8Q4E3_GOSRA|nr:hypothetical protein [Gossypium raimondii]
MTTSLSTSLSLLSLKGCLRK